MASSWRSVAQLCSSMNGDEDLTRLRIARAKSLLATDRASVTEVMPRPLVVARD